MCRYLCIFAIRFVNNLIMKKISLLLFLLFVYHVVYADDSGQCGENVYYKYDATSNLLTIYGEGQMYDYCEIIYSSNSTQINNYPTPWDAYKRDVKDLYVEAGVTSLGGAAFTEFTSLNTITIPSTIHTINYGAFEGSTSRAIHIYDLLSWMNIEFVSGSSNPAGISDSFFINGEEVKDVLIPSSVSEIKKWCFYSCKWLNTISIPNTIKKIEDCAFRYCSNLISLTIPDGVESIGNLTFGECTSIHSIDLPNSVFSVGSSAFCDCKNLKSVVLPNNLELINDDMFLWCSNLESVVIGSNIKEIRSNAFANCKSLQNIYCYSEIVPETDEWAFWSIEGAYNATLHVPESSVDTYKNTIPWNAFKNIISLNDDDPKADIKKLIFDKNNTKLTIYNLSGRKLNNKAKGLVIENGKKFVKK